MGLILSFFFFVSDPLAAVLSGGFVSLCFICVPGSPECSVHRENLANVHSLIKLFENLLEVKLCQSNKILRQ